MKRRLPPFAAIKAFEAAARHCNFQLAADELGISASAVSHQVKALEDFIKMPLFIRRNNRLILRDEGAVYLDRLSGALDEIENATDALSRNSGRIQLTLNLFPSLADMWLIPRLADFHDSNPDISVRLTTSELTADVRDREADFALIYQDQKDVPEGSPILFEDETIPVASPDYLENATAIQKPEDLLDHTLIASLSEDEEWKYWFDAFGVTNPQSASYLELDMCSTSLKAAKEGLGIAMGRRPYVDDDLASGRLIAPFPQIYNTQWCLSLACTSRGQDLPFAPRFRDWLIETAKGSGAAWQDIG